MVANIGRVEEPRFNIIEEREAMISLGASDNDLVCSLLA